MRHVFVETIRVYSYSAPAHHKELEAVDLLNRARSGDVRMHLPAICLTEARRPIAVKCQPRREADAIRRFRSRARAEQVISPEQERLVREVLVRFEQQVREELSGLDTTLASLRDVGGLELFPLNEKMLLRAVELAALDLPLQPFDQAILAAVLVRAEELRDAGETDLCFCQNDADLQPWDKRGGPKQPLTKLYDAASLWVYQDFEMKTPERPDRWGSVK